MVSRVANAADTNDWQFSERKNFGKLRFWGTTPSLSNWFRRLTQHSHNFWNNRQANAIAKHLALLLSNFQCKELRRKKTSSYWKYSKRKYDVRHSKSKNCNDRAGSYQPQNDLKLPKEKHLRMPFPVRTNIKRLKFAGCCFSK